MLFESWADKVWHQIDLNTCSVDEMVVYTIWTDSIVQCLWLETDSHLASQEIPYL